MQKFSTDNQSIRYEKSNFLHIGLSSALDSESWADGRTQFYYAPRVGLALDVRGGRSSLELGVGYSPVQSPLFYHDLGDYNLSDAKHLRLDCLALSLSYTF